MFLGRMGVVLGATLPVFALAQERISTFEGLVNKFINIIQLVVPLIFAIALVAFLWGIFQYFFSGEEKKEEAKSFLLYSLIGLFVMVSVWGLVRVLTGTFVLDTTIPDYPSLRGGGGSGTQPINYVNPGTDLFPGGAGLQIRPN